MSLRACETGRRHSRQGAGRFFGGRAYRRFHMKRMLIAAACLSVFVASQGRADEIPYKPDLSWDDFQGTPPDDSGFSAETTSGVSSGYATDAPKQANGQWECGLKDI